MFDVVVYFNCPQIFSFATAIRWLEWFEFILVALNLHQCDSATMARFGNDVFVIQFICYVSTEMPMT